MACFLLILTRALEHVFCLGELRLSQVNNSPPPNVFPAGVTNFGKAMYRSLERSTQDIQDGFFFVQCPGLIFLATRWSGPAASASIFSAILDYIIVKVCRIRFSISESFIGFYIYYYYPITTILTCLFFVGLRISWKMLCWMKAWRRNWHLVSPTLYIIIVYRVNLNKLLQIITKLRWSNKDNNN